MTTELETWQAKMAQSAALAERARRVLPDGVSSPVRGGRTFEPHPFYTARAEGAYLYDEDRNRYVDTVMAFGPVILGHAHPEVTQAVQDQAACGLIYGTCNALEVEVAEAVRQMIPTAEMVRFTPSGTEATMHALRLARGFTGKPKILKFEGHYHGNHDAVLVSVNPPLDVVGSERAPVRVPVGSGIPEEHYTHTLVAAWNDLEEAERWIRRHRHELAAVITEPVMANKGFIAPAPGYLQALERICRENDVLFVLDEVITGFRMAPGGAQEVYGLRPDLSTFAKAMANGAPVGAFVGRREIMALLEGGRVRHAGTYNASPLCLAAAKATLDVLRRGEGEVYQTLNRLGTRLQDGLREVATRLTVPVLVQGEGSMMQLYVTRLTQVRTYREAAATRRDLFREFAHRMILRGVFVHPDNYEHWFLSAAHTDREVDAILQAAEDTLREMKGEGLFAAV
ncbi:MAG: glutamate-1-semialdehyde 2,1-aminomutase [Armatimonadota bacterium]|nr:glutamate-1-semialdehyde 2,1-aminomutase [Armatimonadota bacterium]